MLAGNLSLKSIQRRFVDLKRQQLRRRPVPLWLERAVLEPERFFIRDFMKQAFCEDSLVYLAAGDDERPLQLTGLYHSIIYVDMNYSQYWLNQYIKPWNLKGYTCTWHSTKLLMPRVEIKNTQREIAERLVGRYLLLDRGDTPVKATSRGVIEALEREETEDGNINAYFYMYTRKPEYGESHGPSCISLTLVSGGGITFYYKYFVSRGIKPTVFTSHNEGMFNVVQMESAPNGILYNIMRLHPSGLPSYYLYKPKFLEYSTLVYESSNPNIPSLWKLDHKTNNYNNFESG